MHEIKTWNRWEALRDEGDEGVASHIVEFFKNRDLPKVELLIIDGSNLLHGGKLNLGDPNIQPRVGNVVVVIKHEDYAKIKSSVYSLLPDFHGNLPMLCLVLHVHRCINDDDVPCIQYERSKCTIRHRKTDTYGPDHKYCEFDDVACTELNRVLNTKYYDIASGVAVVSRDNGVKKYQTLIEEFNYIFDDWAAHKMEITLYEFRR